MRGDGTGQPIVTRSALGLAAAIREARLSSREVVDAHIELVERLNPGLNAIVAERFARAREEAKDADRRVASAGDGGELPPLLGVPCTVKESFALAGMPNCAGLEAHCERIAAGNATAVQRLIDAGAIPLGVSNISELTLWIESSNPVYGRTGNAYDRSRTAGGSSGGEGAAIGAGFAPIGLGTDIGGSIRLPAFFNGVFGHKPTSRLVPHTGHYPAPNERGTAMFAAGPLARRAEDLWPVVEAIAGPDGSDASCEPIELGDPDAVSLEGLEVAIAHRPTLLPIARELREAVDRAADVLAAAGARVRRVDVAGLATVIQPYLTAMRESGALAEILTEAGYERPNALRLAARSLRRADRHTPALLLTLAAEQASALVPDSLDRRAAAAERALRETVGEAIGDGLLVHPPFARTAPRHGRTVGRPWMLAPQAVVNLLGLPATAVPTGFDRSGLPLGVQLIASRGADHLAIAAARELERAFGGWVPPRATIGAPATVRSG